MIDKKLKSIVDRIESLEEEQRGLGADKSDLYSEAKGAGYNPKALRKIIAERKAKDQSEIEAEMEAYRAALGMPGATYRSVADEMGIPRSTLHRRVPRQKNGTTPHDPETGEITEINPGAGAAETAKPEGQAAPTEGAPDINSDAKDTIDDAIPHQQRASAVGAASLPVAESGIGAGHTIRESCGSLDGQAGGVADSAPPVPRADTTAPAGIKPGPQDIDLTIPPFLDRRSPVCRALP